MQVKNMGFIWETPEEINLDIAKRLKTIRKRKGFTQQQLSERSNASYEYERSRETA